MSKVNVNIKVRESNNYWIDLDKDHSLYNKSYEIIFSLKRDEENEYKYEKFISAASMATAIEQFKDYLASIGCQDLIKYVVEEDIMHN